MYINLIWPLLLLVTAYALAVRLLAAAARAAGVPARWALWTGFVLFGGLSGALAAWLWPFDSAVYANVFAVWTGDVLHWSAVRVVGDPTSARAAESVPVWLQVPAVYVSAGLFLGVVCGAPAHWLVNRRAAQGRPQAVRPHRLLPSHPVKQP